MKRIVPVIVIMIASGCAGYIYGYRVGKRADISNIFEEFGVQSDLKEYYEATSVMVPLGGEKYTLEQRLAAAEYISNFPMPSDRMLSFIMMANNDPSPQARKYAFNQFQDEIAITISDMKLSIKGSIDEEQDEDLYEAKMMFVKRYSDITD